MDLNEEVRRGFTVTRERKLLWACQLDMLKELLDVCRRHGIRIFADAGTLIGAVREKGFIPWDDDIDMVMLREDYQKLCAVAEREFKEPLFFQTIYSDRFYGNRHAQLRNSATTCIRTDGRYPRHNAGVFIDIFVLDSIPSSVRGAARMFRRVKRHMLGVKTAVKLVKHMPRWFYDRVGLDRRMYRRYERELMAHAGERNRYVSKISLHWREFLFDKEDYADTVMLPFEDIMIPAPVGYDRILTINYGDYMTPTKAPSGHGTLLFDTTRSYRTYPDPATLTKL